MPRINSPLLDEIGGVYCIPCKVCDRVYVGQTGKSLLERIKQHKYNIRTANESSAVFKHQQKFNHNINWESAKFVCKCNHQIKRLIIESCIIKKCNVMNLNDGLYKIDTMLTKSIQSSFQVKIPISFCDNGWTRLFAFYGFIVYEVSF